MNPEQAEFLNKHFPGVREVVSWEWSGNEHSLPEGYVTSGMQVSDGTVLFTVFHYIDPIDKSLDVSVYEKNRYDSPRNATGLELAMLAIYAEQEVGNENPMTLDLRNNAKGQLVSEHRAINEGLLMLTGFTCELQTEA